MPRPVRAICLPDLSLRASSYLPACPPTLPTCNPLVPFLTHTQTHTHEHTHTYTHTLSLSLRTPPRK